MQNSIAFCKFVRILARRHARTHARMHARVRGSTFTRVSVFHACIIRVLPQSLSCQLAIVYNTRRLRTIFSFIFWSAKFSLASVWFRGWWVYPRTYHRAKWAKQTQSRIWHLLKNLLVYLFCRDSNVLRLGMSRNVLLSVENNFFPSLKFLPLKDW